MPLWCVIQGGIVCLPCDCAHVLRESELKAYDGHSGVYRLIV